MNFSKKLILAIIPIDVQHGTYQSVISYFNGKGNVLSGKGFWNSAKEDIDEQKDTFSVGDSIYLGKISFNGKYVAPNDLDCSVDSFPGVWDIEKKMKVVFSSDEDNSVVENKCQELFSGSKTLNELGGRVSKNSGYGAN